MMSKAVVLDSSAILAFIQEETGHELVFEPDQQSFVSSVNMEEVRSKLVDRGMEEEAIEASLKYLGLQVKDFTNDDAKISARLRRDSRKSGLSLGDRACLALATLLNLTAKTADKAWTNVDLHVRVELIR